MSVRLFMQLLYVNKIRFFPIPKPRESPYINQTPYLQRYQAWWVLHPLLSVVVRVAHRATLVQVRRSASQRTMPFIARNFLEISTNTRTFYRVSAIEYTVIQYCISTLPVIYESNARFLFVPKDDKVIHTRVIINRIKMINSVAVARKMCVVSRGKEGI